MSVKLKKMKALFTRNSKEPPAVAQSSDSEMIYIRVRQSVVVSPTTSNLDNQPSSALGHFYLIEGSLGDIRRYAGTTVDWIIKVAHFICDPSGTGQVYTHIAGTSLHWLNRDRNAADWRPVVRGDPLLPGIYEFMTTRSITLSKISERQSHSVTSMGSESSANTFCRHLNVRDNGCVVTRSISASLIASHLIPKRLGTDGAREVVTRFVGAQALPDIHRFHPSIGVLLIATLDTLVNCYKLGFYHVAGNTYTLHNFDADDPDLTCLGLTAPIVANLSIPYLHMFPVTLSVHAGDYPLPPKGIFDWHYLQCVLRRFGTDQYKGLPNIAFFVYPFKTADDESGDEFEDDANDEPPYPSYRLDRFMAQQWEKHQEQEHFKEVAQWASEVASEVE